jgi:hypothetical protein
LEQVEQKVNWKQLCSVVAVKQTAVEPFETLSVVPIVDYYQLTIHH